MAVSDLGKVFLIANPKAQSGHGAKVLGFARSFLNSYTSAMDGFVVAETAAPGDGYTLAAEATGFSTVIALGGDGLIHEVVGGLMKQDKKKRPALGVIPVGTGNDYARTLGYSITDVGAALSQLIRSRRMSADLGRVNDVYFMETLSFGSDAAIALDTSKRRAADEQAKGSGLYVSSALKILSKTRKGFPCHARFDGVERKLDSIVLAIQVGPSYGGGFKICPGAHIDDGYLDVCYNVRMPSLPHTLALLGLARFGKHTGSSLLEFAQIKNAVLDFETPPPAQTDGERLEGTHFEIGVVPKALTVLVP